ncbi:MAG: ATP-grasp domain-containing protein [Verrucomicrobiae bacterium]|nr:ATP-grasp domain-containing protein [Verrucomicrobiae bacterium]
MNVLITSSGRRTTLTDMFVKAVHSRGGKVFAGDMDGLAPTLYMVDKAFKLPPVTDVSYISFLVDLVREHRIDLIVPTIDTELPILSKNMKLLKDVGAFPLVSAKTLVDCSCDKLLTFQIFKEAGFRTPRSWIPGDLKFSELPDELFLKPRNGSASLHAYAVKKNDLSSMLSKVPFPLIQEQIQGREITIDALLDLNGNPIHYVPRIRVRTVGGESIQGITISNSGMEKWFEKILLTIQSLGGIGPMTLQAFLVDEGDPIFFEINPRFGGGFPLGYAAGADYPEWILQMIEGKRVFPRLGQYKKGVYMTRYYKEIIVENPLWLI